ncbi:DUF1294 domain-containing protein [Vannielia litorea]|uniref:Uncharacterized membrane protein YsdA, DUF1294 family n=1 Tax=Vannielia litorea TaxID=1217970 RepID=A0A1N6EG67_9RHOB|nr:DUF1294 domain-containing protein [Vannielia litorea]SIN82055.1 Uncharacterized membrane protein YsdA, DUF1294 family [Vannielia litorea]
MQQHPWDSLGLTGPHLVLLAFLALLLSNTLIVVLFSIDKRRAANGDWRISEATLLFVTALGAYPGAKFAQRYFRHKTRKKPFVWQLDILGATQVLAILLLVVPASRQT